MATSCSLGTQLCLVQWKDKAQNYGNSCDQSREVEEKAARWKKKMLVRAVSDYWLIGLATAIDGKGNFWYRIAMLIILGITLCSWSSTQPSTHLCASFNKGRLLIRSACWLVQENPRSGELRCKMELWLSFGWTAGNWPEHQLHRTAEFALRLLISRICLLASEICQTIPFDGLKRPECWLAICIGYRTNQGTLRQLFNIHKSLRESYREQKRSATKPEE